jgi:hypothetical protein
MYVNTFFITSISRYRQTFIQLRYFSHIGIQKGICVLLVLITCIQLHLRHMPAMTLNLTSIFSNHDALLSTVIQHCD